MGSRVALWWRPITNIRARSAEDPHCAGINYSLPFAYRNSQTVTNYGAHFCRSFSLWYLASNLTLNVCRCCWGGTKHTLSIVKASPRCPLMMRLFILQLESQTPCLRLISSSWSSLQVICSNSESEITRLAGVEIICCLGGETGMWFQNCLFKEQSARP